MRYGAIAASSRASAAARFYADPGPGNFYMGMTPTKSSLATHETKMGAPVAMVRIFASGNAPPWSAADTAIAGGRIPWISWKEGTFTNADIANGVHDDWIHGIAGEFKARAPQVIFWTFHHEPENDAVSNGANAAAYRAAQRRIKTTFRADGVTNDVFAAVLFMCPFTFQASSGRDWRTWYPDWRNITGLGTAAAPDPNDFWKHGDASSVVDVFGIDFYHDWELDKIPGDTMSTFTKNMASAVWANNLGPRTSFLNQPYAIGEWSTAAAQTAPKDPNADGTWTLTEYATSLAGGAITFFPDQTDAYIDDYFTTMTAHGCVAFCWWDDQASTAANAVSNDPLSVADPNETRWKRLGVWAAKPQAKTDPT